jgi:DNA-binding protein YbaB
MTEPDLSVEQREARVAQLRQEADGAMTELRAKLAGVRAAQEQALATTGEATSRDGSVRATVDATGVVTSLRFAPSPFQRSTPEKLAQATVATIQAAAAQARAQVSATLAPVREEGSRVLAAAAGGMSELRAARLGVPEVPRTAVDPAEDAWHHGQPEPSPPAPPSRPARADRGEEDDWESGGSLLR